jgi:predicted ATP-binding protein involved in virulence
MIVEFYVNYLKNYYSDTYDINNNYENCDDYFNLYNNNYDELKNILSDKIDNDNVNSEILHIFPITLSCIITLFASIYLYI